MNVQTKLALFTILITAHAAALSDAQDPPRTIEPAPLQPVQPKEKKPTAVVFGETYEDSRILRPRIGVSHTRAGIRPATWPEGGAPTNEEFDAWLALPDDHEFAKDLDGYLESIR